MIPLDERKAPTVPTDTPYSLVVPHTAAGQTRTLKSTDDVMTAVAGALKMGCPVIAVVKSKDRAGGWHVTIGVDG